MKMKKRCHGGQRRSYRREGSSLFLSLRKEIHGRASAGASQRDAKGGPQHLGSRFRVAHPPRALYLTWSALKNSPGSLFTKYYYVCQILGPSKNGSCLIPVVYKLERSKGTFSSIVPAGSRSFMSMYVLSIKTSISTVWYIAWAFANSFSNLGKI